MDEEKYRNDECEHEYYGFSSTQLSSELKLRVQFHILDISNAFEAIWGESVDPGTIKKHIEDLKNLYMKNIRQPLKEFKELSHEIFKIKPNIVFEKDKYYPQQFTDEEIKKLEEDIKVLREEIQKEKLFSKMCQQELRTTENIIAPLSEKLNTSLKCSIGKKTEEDFKLIEKLQREQNELIKSFSAMKFFKYSDN